jgi:hypothetical protein
MVSVQQYSCQPDTGREAVQPCAKAGVRESPQRGGFFPLYTRAPRQTRHRSPDRTRRGACRMDGSQFDTLLRGLTIARSRRGAVVGLLGGALGVLGLTKSEAKHKKKKKKKGGSPPVSPPASPPASPPVSPPSPPPCTPQCSGKTCGSDGCGGSCGPCTGGVCLANDSCGQSCDQPGACGTTSPPCSCNVNNGDPVCRRSVGAALVHCDQLSTCTTTADCPPNTVCSSICSPSACVPLC